MFLLHELREEEGFLRGVLLLAHDVRRLLCRTIDACKILLAMDGGSSLIILR